MWKVVNRLLLCVLLGFFITFLPLAIQTALFDPASLDGVTARIVTTLLYWPTFFLRVGGLDCPNADFIADKLRCMGISLAIDVFTYSSICFVLFWWIGKRRQRTRA
jgi:hypothetical protein